MIVRNLCSRSNEMRAHHRAKSPLTISEMCSLPRARRFTGLLLQRGAGQTVSSPYAGDHRWSISSLSPSTSIFPVRGGSPDMDNYIDIRHECLPRARGFTDLVPLPRDHVVVSSPCAGVHRRTTISGLTRSRVSDEQPHPRRSSSKMRLHDRLHYWCLPSRTGRRTLPAVPEWRPSER